MGILNAVGKRHEICKILPKQSFGAEIGVFAGQFAKSLAKATDPASFLLIDPWWTRYGDVFSWRKDVKTRDVYQETLNRMKWWIDRGIAKVKVQRSQDALVEMDDATLDWVYLDSSHDYAETREELNLLRSKVKSTGVISGHDFNTSRHPGVFRAVAHFLRDNSDYEIFYIDNFNQWAIRKVID